MRLGVTLTQGGERNLGAKRYAFHNGVRASMASPFDGSRLRTQMASESPAAVIRGESNLLLWLPSPRFGERGWG